MRDHTHETAAAHFAARRQAILDGTFVVSGGADDDDAPPAEGTPPAEGAPATPPADAPGEPQGTPDNGTPAEGGEPQGDDANASEAEASIVVPELPGDPQAEHPLAAVDETELRTLHASLEALFAEHAPNAGPEQVAPLTLIRDHQAAIVAELTRRRVELDEATAALEALANAGAELPEALPQPALASAAATAGSRGTQQAAAVQAPPAPARTRPRAALQAAAGASTSVAPGGEMTLEDLGEAIDNVKTGPAGTSLLATIPSFAEMVNAGADLPEMLSDRNTAERNTELIRETQDDFMAARRGVQPAARQTAICEPLDTIREIPDNFNASEPVSSELPSRPAGRLGFQHVRSIALAAVEAGVPLWTEAEQALVSATDQATWKPCVEVECPTPVSVVAEEVPACLIFDDTTEMSSPEVVRNYMNALDAQRARVKQGRVLQRLDSLSSRYTYTGSYGARSALIEAINYAVGRASYANRQDDPDLTLFINPLTAGLLRNDRAARAFGQDCTSCDLLDQLRDEIEGVARVRVTLDAARDGEPGLPPEAVNPVGAGAIPLSSTAGTHRIRLIDPRAFIYAETGKRNTGVERDPQLQRMNKAQLFGREWFLLDLTGPWANFSIDVNLCDDGSRAGFIVPHGCES